MGTQHQSTTNISTCRQKSETKTNLVVLPLRSLINRHRGASLPHSTVTNIKKNGDIALQPASSISLLSQYGNISTHCGARATYHLIGRVRLLAGNGPVTGLPLMSGLRQPGRAGPAFSFNVLYPPSFCLFA